MDSRCQEAGDCRSLSFGLGLILPITASAQQEKPTIASLNELGAEGSILAQRVGLWDVTETEWASPTAPPVTTKGLVAERVLMGTLLQEIIREPGAPPRRPSSAPISCPTPACKGVGDMSLSIPVRRLD